MKIYYRLSIILVFITVSLSSFAQEEIIIPADTIPTNDSDTFVFVDVYPEFPGGDKAKSDYIRAFFSIHNYPTYAMENQIQGRVYISFIVEKDGRITNVRILRGIGGGCDELSLKAVREMPNWTPGIADGKVVRCSMVIPISFHLSG